ncbi:MAG: hypothetical protein QS721_06250 [Candidatus Endonucleobacter sp. (ex Gigantidas childressi)]|nr:hypothetical protein [Candidatus Endonucleobacter sp. (ex Gigantidas childressi)]
MDAINKTSTEALMIGVSSVAFIAVTAFGVGCYWYQRHINGDGCCSSHRELPTEDGDHPSGKDEQTPDENMIMIEFLDAVE